MPNTAIAAVTEIAANSHSVITKSQAAVHRSDKRIATATRAGWLIEVYPGVFVIAGAPRTYQQSVVAALAAAGGHAIASHRTAARLHRLDGLEGTAQIEISVQRSHRWQQSGDVVTHHVTPMDPVDIVAVDGIATAGLARTLSDLGSIPACRDRVGQALTDVRRRGCSINWIRQTNDRLHRPGQRGPTVLARLLDAIPCEGVVPDSWFEELLAKCLADPRIPQLDHQHVVRNAGGGFVARLDLAVPALRIGIEAHSRRHHFGPGAEASDEHRDLRLAACGWDLIYFGWHVMRQPSEVVDLLADVVESRGRREV